MSEDVARPSVERLLVASRGPAAWRVLGSAAGLETVVLFSEDDAAAAWPEQADYAVFLSAHSDRDAPTKSADLCPGMPGAWADPAVIVERAVDAGCDVIHPGSGPLVRHKPLVEHASRAGVRVVGPGPVLLDAVNDRVAIRRLAEEHGVPVVPGSGRVDDLAVARAWLATTGFPVRVKAVDAHRHLGFELLPDLETALARAEQALHGGAVYLERFVVGAREVEVPVVGDGRGVAIAVGDREVTVSWGGRHAVVEAPAPALDDQMRHHMRTSAEGLCRAIGWTGLGAVRFLVTPDGRAYLLQIRPGLQAWDAATELLFDADLVDVQLRMACDEPLVWQRESIVPRGHVLWVAMRATGCGVVEAVRAPEGIRTDLAHGVGVAVQPGDLLGSVWVRAPTRGAAIVQARAALERIAVDGVTHDADRARALFAEPSYWKAPLDRDRIARWLGSPMESGEVERDGR